MLWNYIKAKITPINIISTNFDDTLILRKQDTLQSEIVLWKNDVVECKIVDDCRNYYYLHFENDDFNRSKKLIDDFLFFENDFFNKEGKHILICCSSGFTSSLLVDGLNRIIKEMNYRMTVEFGNSYSTTHTYDLILLAPQIGHLKHQFNGNIHCIPTNMYGSSNYHTLLTFIMNHI